MPSVLAMSLCDPRLRVSHGITRKADQDPDESRMGFATMACSKLASRHSVPQSRVFGHGYGPLRSLGPLDLRPQMVSVLADVDDVPQNGSVLTADMISGQGAVIRHALLGNGR